MKRIIVLLALAQLFAACTTREPEITAQHYCDSLTAEDFTAFKSLFAEDRQKYFSEDVFKRINLTSCEVEAVSSSYVTIRYQFHPDEQSPKMIGSLYIFPNGKIKYDPIFLGHPALALRGILSQMEHEDVRYRQSAQRTLTKWEIPLFGFLPDAEVNVRTKSISAFRDWIDENEATFDLGKVKIPVSSIDQQRTENASHNHNMVRTSYVGPDI